MERFSWKGLWQHVGSTVLAAGLLVADPLLSYLNIIALPAWGHALVGLAIAGLAFYKGKVQPSTPQLIP